MPETREVLRILAGVGEAVDVGNTFAENVNTMTVVSSTLALLPSHTQ